MKYQLFQYHDSTGAIRTGLHVEGGFYALPGRTIDELLVDWDASQRMLRSLVAGLVTAAGSTLDLAPLNPQHLSYAPPLTSGGVIYAAGANYRDHVEAMARALKMPLTADPKAEGIPPWHFIKAGGGVRVGHGQTIVYPRQTRSLDWEAELAVVIGYTAREVPVESALKYVAGYTCANDLSARDALRRDKVHPSSPFHFDWVGQKCFVGSCPLGPMLTPAEFIVSPENLDIKLWVNGVIKQDSNTQNHIYSVAEQISHLSQLVVLQPGDIILTGTPAGVGMETRTFLSRGDVVRVQIQDLGTLENALS
jgi:2-keto-4-pentenoate hydratase/2-oxohepta-3-ene-1,7-dioic acid hydratase in catechol pathway